MKSYFLIFCLVALASCEKNNKTKDFKDSLQTKDSISFNQEGKIIDVSHYKNNIREGFSIVFNDGNRVPKYFVEYNKGKRDGIIIELYDDGRIKSFRTGGINSNSQRIKFHENGILKSIGNTIHGKGNGTWYYFDEDGELENEILYENGQILHE